TTDILARQGPRRTMVLASALRVGLAKDAVSVASRRAAAAVVGVRRLGAAAAVEELAPLYPDAVLTAPETQQAKLGNGVRVATEAGGGPVAALTVSVDLGSRYESQENNGVCSVIGASAFTGSESAIAAMGGQFTQTVDREVMTYSATVLKADVQKAMAVLADAVKATNLSSAEALQAAKGAILDKIEAERRDPRLGLMDHLHDAAFLDTAMGMSTLGTAESVSALGLDGAKNFYGRSLAGSRVVVAGAGAVHQGALTDMAQNLLGDVPSSSSSAIEEGVEPAYFIGSDKRMRFDSMPNAHVAFAFKAPAAGSKDSLSIMMIEALLGFEYNERTILGVNAASKWAQELADLNLAAVATPFYKGYKDAGLMGVSCIAADNHLDDFMWYTLHNLLHIVHKVTDAEVEAAKTLLKNRLYQQNSGCADAASIIADAVRQFDRRVPYAEMVARIDAITTKEIQASADSIINDQDHALAAVGPIHELPDFNWIRRRSFWLR
ncbi:unnamed protein product, partial [Pylaiella littoralis]